MSTPLEDAVKDVIDRTATIVAKVGSSFESKIISKGRHKEKFSFLFPDDPNHGYYQRRLEECRAEIDQGDALNPMSYFTRENRNSYGASTSSGNSSEERSRQEAEAERLRKGPDPFAYIY